MPRTRHITSRTNRATGSQVTLYDTGDYGYHRYHVRCDTHGSESTQRYTRDDIWPFLTHPDRFCSACATAREQRGQRPSRSRRSSSTRAQGLARRFGVELEFNGVSRRRVQDAITEGRIPSGWRVKSDPSVSGEGLELVSPPLSGEEGLEQVRVACQVLNDLGARVNRTAGLHVHHDMRGMSADQIKRFVEAYVENQHLLDWLVSPSRRGVNGPTYCGSVSRHELDRVKAARNEREIGYAMMSRYRAINPSAYLRHGTIEIRQHQGTTNFAKVASWIKLGQALADAAAAGPVGRKSGLRELFSSVSLEENATAFLSGRALQLGADVAVV